MLSLELRLLTYAVALLFVLVLIQGYAGLKAQGARAMGGPRDDLPPPSKFQARSKRLVENYRENLWFFAPLVLVAALTNVSNQWTELGGRLFFYSRIVHAIFYLAALPSPLRPLAWLVGVIGCVLIFLSVLGVLQ